MRDFCPACEEEVEYEGDGRNASCSVCGRTRSAAAQSASTRKSAARDRKWRPIITVVGWALIIGSLAFMFMRSDENGKGNLIAIAVMGGVLALIFGRKK